MNHGYKFLSGDLNVAKRPEVRQKMREHHWSKTGIITPPTLGKHFVGRKGWKHSGNVKLKLRMSWTDKRKKNARIRMLTNNPMKNPESVKKAFQKRNWQEIAKKTLETNLLNGSFEKHRERMKNDNPMKKPEIVSKVVKKKTESGYYRNVTPHLREFIKCPSKPQIKLFNNIKERFPDARPEYFVWVDGEIFFLDIALLEYKIDIEYDGWYWHQDKEKDARRDDLLKSVGWNIIRISDRGIN